MSNGRSQAGGNGAGPSAFSMYASRFLNGNAPRDAAVEGSQVSDFHAIWWTSLSSPTAYRAFSSRPYPASSSLLHAWSANARSSALPRPIRLLTTPSFPLRLAPNLTLIYAADLAHPLSPARHHSPGQGSTRCPISIPIHPVMVVV